jgi:hypothetical protein
MPVEPLDGLQKQVRDLQEQVSKFEDRIAKFEEWELVARIVKNLGGKLVGGLLTIATISAIAMVGGTLVFRVQDEVEKVGLTEVKKQMEQRVRDFDMKTEKLASLSSLQRYERKTLRDGQRTATLYDFCRDDWCGLIVVGISVDDKQYANEIWQVDMRSKPPTVVPPNGSEIALDVQKSDLKVRLKADGTKLAVGPQSTTKVCVARFGVVEPGLWDDVYALN